jgi:SprT protein
MKGSKMENIIDVKEAVLKRFLECYVIAKQHGYDLDKIEVRFNLTGTAAGCFVQSIFEKFFDVNLVLAQQNLVEYLNQTVPHEFAHYIVCSQRHLKKPMKHGKEWKSIMILVFGLSPKIFHSYNVSHVKTWRGLKTFKYKCNCQDHYVSAILHKRMMSGQHRRCCACKERIEFAS